MDPLKALQAALDAVRKDRKAKTSQELGELAILSGIDIDPDDFNKTGLIVRLQAELTALLEAEETVAEVVVLPVPAQASETAPAAIVAGSSGPSIPPPGAAPAPVARGTGRGQGGPQQGFARGSGVTNPMHGLAHAHAGTAHVTAGQVNPLSAHVVAGAAGMPAIPPPHTAHQVAGGGAPAAVARPAGTVLTTSPLDQVIALIRAAGRNIAGATARAGETAPGVLEALDTLGQQAAQALKTLEDAVHGTTLTPPGVGPTDAEKQAAAEKLAKVKKLEAAVKKAEAEEKKQKAEAEKQKKAEAERKKKAEAEKKKKAQAEKKKADAEKKKKAQAEKKKADAEKKKKADADKAAADKAAAAKADG